MFAEMDWTAIVIASIGLASTIVTLLATVRVKQLEARAAADAHRSAGHAANAKSSADSVKIKHKRKKKPPTHPDG